MSTNNSTMRKTAGPHWRQYKNKRARSARIVQNYEEILGPFLTCPAFEIGPEDEQINLVKVETKTKWGRLPFSRVDYYNELSIPLPTVELPMTLSMMKSLFLN